MKRTKWILKPLMLAISILSSALAFSQQPTFSVDDSLAAALDKKDYCIIAEVHFFQFETAPIQLAIIDHLIKSGEKKIIIYTEAPPSVAFWMQRYIDSGDTTVFINPFILGNKSEFLFGLRRLSGEAVFQVVALDVEFPESFDLFSELFNYSFSLMDSSFIDPVYNKLRSAKTKKKYKKALKHLDENDLLKLVTHPQLDSLTREGLKQTITLINEHGFMKGGFRGKSAIARNRNFAEMVDLKRNESSFHFITVGRAHVMKMYKRPNPVFIDYLGSADRSDFVIVAPVYSVTPFFLYEGDFYGSEDDYKKLIGMGVIDFIIRKQP